jgi:hypothetical protein
MLRAKLNHESSFRAKAPQGEVITGTTQVIRETTGNSA